MNAIFDLMQRLAYPFLRISMGIVVFWIGALKFVDPSPVVDLLGASLPFLASAGFVYLLGVAEVVVAVMLLTSFRVQYASLVLMGLFLGTVTIFVVAPKVVYGEAGFPLLALPGEFLIKDLVLFSASMSLAAMASARAAARPMAGIVRARAA